MTTTRTTKTAAPKAATPKAAAPTSTQPPTASAEELQQQAQKAEADAREAARQAELAKEAEARSSANKPKVAIVGASDEPTVTLRMLSVKIVRDEKTVIPVDAFEHELPILQAIFGADFVQTASTENVKVANFNAHDELARLKRKYKVAGANPEGADVVGRVYRDARELAQQAGVDFEHGQAKAPAASVQSSARRGKTIGATKR